MKKIIALLAASVLAGSVSAATVDELVVPYSPGGVVGTFAQIVQKYLTEDLNTGTVIVNKPGADGKIGVRYVLDSSPTRNTWIMASTGPFLFNHLMYKDPGYSQHEFDLVLPMAVSPSIIAVSNQSGISNLKEFITYARTKPMNCGTSNAGALFLTKYLVSKLNLTNVQIINYKGAGEVSQALMSGSIECSVDTIQSQIVYHNSKKLKIIAIATQTKQAEVPNANLFSEVIPGFTFNSWYGIGIPKSHNTANKAEILEALRKLTQTEKYKSTIRELGLEPFTPPKDSNQFIETQYRKYEAMRLAASIAKLD